MNIIKSTILILLVTVFVTGALKADEIKVIRNNINTIDIFLNSEYFTIIELENEVINLATLNTKSLNVQKLNNKSVLIYAYDNNLPNFLGKIIINDSCCNSYAINLLKGKQSKDQVISITNSNKLKTCTPPDKKGFDGFSTMASTKVLYANPNK